MIFLNNFPFFLLELITLFFSPLQQNFSLKSALVFINLFILQEFKNKFLKAEMDSTNQRFVSNLKLIQRTFPLDSLARDFHEAFSANPDLAIRSILNQVAGDSGKSTKALAILFLINKKIDNYKKTVKLLESIRANFEHYIRFIICPENLFSWYLDLIGHLCDFFCLREEDVQEQLISPFLFPKDASIPSESSLFVALRVLRAAEKALISEKEKILEKLFELAEHKQEYPKIQNLLIVSKTKDCKKKKKERFF